LTGAFSLGLAEVGKRFAPASSANSSPDDAKLPARTSAGTGQEAAEQKHSLLRHGVVTEVSSTLIQDLAKLAEGKWSYIDFNHASEAHASFVEELFRTPRGHRLQSTSNGLKPFQVHHINRVPPVCPRSRNFRSAAATVKPLIRLSLHLRQDKPSRYTSSNDASAPTPTQYLLSHIEITYYLGSGKRETTGDVPLKSQYAHASRVNDFSTPSRSSHKID